MVQNEILALILARGGSKGIPRKNIKKMLGKPLITYTIEAALNSKYIDRLVVSTDDNKIAELCKKNGADVPFMRPAELATDDSGSNKAILHALEWLKEKENYIPDYFALLQPTSPLRTAEDIDQAIEKLKNSKNANSLKSVYKTQESPYWMREINEEGYLKPFIEKDENYYQRQKLPDLFMPNGAIYIIETAIFLKKLSFNTKKTIPYIMNYKKSIDIDDENDWKIAEMFLKEILQ